VRLTAVDLACVSGLWVSRVSKPGTVCRDGSWILIGPAAVDDRIATVACRCLLERALAPKKPTDAAVRELVQEHGFRFAAEKRPQRALRGTSPRKVKQSA